MKAELEKHIQYAKSRKKEYGNFFKKIKSRPPKNLDAQFHRLHDEVFEEIDCLDCANCCKTTSPAFYAKDVERLASYLNMKVAAFEENYLRRDSDGDLVLQTAPCPFLMHDNKCSVYEARPKACREYPHTNRRKMQQILDLTLKNTRICPATAEIVKRIKQQYEKQIK